MLEFVTQLQNQVAASCCESPSELLFETNQSSLKSWGHTLYNQCLNSKPNYTRLTLTSISTKWWDISDKSVLPATPAFLMGTSGGAISTTWSSWWFQIFFMFTPIWRFPISQAYFSDGLVQPPTSDVQQKKYPTASLSSSQPLLARDVLIRPVESVSTKSPVERDGDRTRIFLFPMNFGRKVVVQGGPPIQL